MIHDSMLYDPIKGQCQCHGGPKLMKVVDFKAYLLRQYLIKRLMVNYDTPRQF